MSSELRSQFINYMTLQRFSDHTKRSYLTGVKLLAKHYMQSPDSLTVADAILDRLIHNAHKIKLKGESMRKIRSPLTKEKTL